MTTLTIIFTIQAILLGISILAGVSKDRSTTNLIELSLIEFLDKLITLQLLLAIGSIVYIILSKLLV